MGPSARILAERNSLGHRERNRCDYTQLKRKERSRRVSSVSEKEYRHLERLKTIMRDPRINKRIKTMNLVVLILLKMKKTFNTIN